MTDEIILQQVERDELNNEIIELRKKLDEQEVILQKMKLLPLSLVYPCLIAKARMTVCSKNSRKEL